MKKIVSIFLLIVCIIFPRGANGSMSSADYVIYADGIDIGGGLSGGGSFSLEDTVGETPIETMTGGIYTVRGGYQSMSSSSISMAISSSTLNLGILSAGAVSSSSTTSTISTDSEAGYTLSVGEVSGTSITAVADGQVTAGQEEYGIGVSGADSQFSGDMAVAEGLIISSTGAMATAAQTQIIFKASISILSAAGNYSQDVPLIAAVNL